MALVVNIIFSFLDVEAIKLSIDPKGSYSLDVGSTTWLKSSPTFATAGGKTYTTDSTSTPLVLKSSSSAKGKDNAGAWMGTFYLYQFGSTSIFLQASIRQYDTFAIFDQVSVFGSLTLKSRAVILLFAKGKVFITNNSEGWENIKILVSENFSIF